MQAKEFAKFFNDGDSEEKLEREFNSKWSTWISELNIPESENTAKDRKTTAITKLKYEFYRNSNVFEQELNKSGLKDGKPLKSLENAYIISQSLEHDDFDNKPSNHVENRFIPKPRLLQKAREVVDSCIHANILWIKKFNNLVQEFDAGILLENLIDKCKLEKYQPEKMKQDLNITFLRHFQIKLTVYITAMAFPIFEQMQERHEKKNGLKGRVESEKQDFWNIFKAAVKKEKCEMSLASGFAKIV